MLKAPRLASGRPTISVYRPVPKRVVYGQEHSSFFVYLHPYAPYWGLSEEDLAAFEKQRSGSR